MSKDLFQDIPKEQRAKMLQEQAYKIEELPVKRAFAKEDLDAFKDELSERMVTVNQLEEELDGIKETYKNKLKPEKQRVGELVGNVKRKYAESLEAVYQLANYSEKVMEYYDGDGLFLESRPLMPHEKQMGVFNIDKTKTA